jgi:DNA (cytosine-5)-methyltransferase 3A
METVLNNFCAEGLNVLSLFDGMSCGQLALQKAGIKVKQYYAAEIDKYAIQVTQKNFPNTIQLGDVTKVKGSDLPKIDLIIGGSPCQGFSFAGKGLNFEDPRSKLFFEFVRLIKECNPKWFFLENVRMKKEHELVISQYMKVAPIEINSSLVSAQNRVRLYWTNINEKPYGLFGDMVADIPQPKDQGVLLQDVLEDNVPDKFYLTDKALARIEKAATLGIKAKIDPLKSGTITLKNQSGQLAIDNSTTLIENLKGCLKFGRTDEAKQLRKESMAKGKDHTPFQKKQINEIDFEKMNTLTTAITKDNIICEIMGNKANTLTPDAYLATGERNRDENGKAVLTSMCDRRLRRLTPTECERLQTVPVGYTDGVSDTQRYRMLGNGWTVDVIAHFFVFLKGEEKKLFKTEPKC